jgi:outer membrane lipoprotein-sorting protein
MHRTQTWSAARGARRGLTFAIALAALAGWTLTAAPALAKAGKRPVTIAQLDATAPAEASPPAQPQVDPTPPPAMAAATPVSQLTPQQVETLGRISTYFNKIDTLTGDFVQVGPDGSRTQGKFAIQKPGKVRFTYALPSRLDVVSDGTTVAVRDRKLATQDIWPLSQTPLRFLLQSKIDLLKDTNVVAVYNEPETVSVVLEEKSAMAGTSRLMLMFGGTDYQLKQWTITDAQGGDTSVAVFNLDAQAKLDPKLFTIDFTRTHGDNK